MTIQVLKNVFRILRFLKKKNFNRILPLNELINDRWEKASFAGFGEGASIYDTSYIFGDVIVGKDTWVGPFTLLDGSGGLKIGSNCSISAGVQIYTHDTVQWAISGGVKQYEYDKVLIEDNCYIGPNTIIVKGVYLRKGTIVGANSYVNKSFPENSKIAGNPAVIIN
jgi:acetyltransferase-like isoleucine patch superfamily enzyme